MTVRMRTGFLLRSQQQWISLAYTILARREACSLINNKNTPVEKKFGTASSWTSHTWNRLLLCRIPVVKQTLHETSNWCNKGDSSLPPCLLLNLLQQTVGRWKGSRWGFQGNGTAHTDSCGQPAFPLIKQIHRITVLPGIRPKELGSTPGSMKQRQGNYRTDRRKNIFTLSFKIDEKEQRSWHRLIPAYHL